MKITEKIKITNEDNLQLMKRYPDKYFDLAIVDAPYGLDMGNNKSFHSTKNKIYNKKELTDWDKSIPSAYYFEELFRVSKNQIIWGGNYMTEYLRPSRCWIFWDKLKSINNYADGELAWTSFNRNTKKVQIKHDGFNTKDRKTENIPSIHPTQKPVILYEWILNNFAEKGNKILDTHVGSGSIAIACNNLDYELIGCELNTSYFNKMIKRVKNHTNQMKIF